jgi:beta-lactamase regulating signal transducer with metallopeptidase domain
VNLDAFDTLVRVTLAGSAAILAVLLARRALRQRFGALVAYVAWTLVPAAVAAMLLPAPTHPVVALDGLVRVAPLQAASAAVVADALDPRIALFALWLAGALLAAAWFAQQQRRYLRSLGRLHAREGARIVQSDSEFAGPALVGAWRPRIVLPSDFDRRYDARERELILAHERVHFVRGDAWVNAFVVALRSLNWFNPILHYAAAKFRIDQELACDAAVVARFPEARRQYADAMLKVQLAGQPRQELRLPVGCRWPSDRTLKERILMLKHSRPTRATRVVGLCLVAGVTLAFAWPLGRASRRVRRRCRPMGAVSMRPCVSMSTARPESPSASFMRSAASSKSPTMIGARRWSRMPPLVEMSRSMRRCARTVTSFRRRASSPNKANHSPLSLATWATKSFASKARWRSSIQNRVLLLRLRRKRVMSIAMRATPR